MSDIQVFLPYYPPISPYRLPYQAFDLMIAQNAIRLSWLKGHSCICIYNTTQPGTADPQCQTCRGRGFYWDAPSAIFAGLITFIHMSPSPDEPGNIMNTKVGLIQTSEPAITIPYSQAGGVPWTEASLGDLFVEIDATYRFNAQLQVGGLTTIPYQQNLSIPATGAVTIYDNSNHVVDVVSGYTVSGASVALPSGYAAGTNYMVEFTAAPAYVAYRSAGSTPHVRPIGQLTEPRRMRLQNLDLWLRARNQGDIPIAPTS